MADRTGVDGCRAIKSPRSEQAGARRAIRKGRVSREIQSIAKLLNLCRSLLTVRLQNEKSGECHATKMPRLGTVLPLVKRKEGRDSDRGSGELEPRNWRIAICSEMWKWKEGKKEGEIGDLVGLRGNRPAGGGTGRTQSNHHASRLLPDRTNGRTIERKNVRLTTGWSHRRFLAKTLACQDWSKRRGKRERERRRRRRRRPKRKRGDGRRRRGKPFSL